MGPRLFCVPTRQSSAFLRRLLQTHGPGTIGPGRGGTIVEMAADAGHQGGSTEVDAELDLRGVICPYNFVKTKLKLETMEPGQVLAVLLDEGEPIRNVPRSVSDDGHTVLSQEPVAHSYRVIIRKRADS